MEIFYNVVEHMAYYREYNLKTFILCDHIVATDSQVATSFGLDFIIAVHVREFHVYHERILRVPAPVNRYLFRAGYRLQPVIVITTHQENLLSGQNYHLQGVCIDANEYRHDLHFRFTGYSIYVPPHFSVTTTRDGIEPIVLPYHCVYKHVNGPRTDYWCVSDVTAPPRPRVDCNNNILEWR